MRRLTLGQLRALPLPDDTPVVIEGRTEYLPAQRATSAVGLRVDLGGIVKFYRDPQAAGAAGSAIGTHARVVVIDTDQFGLYSKQEQR